MKRKEKHNPHLFQISLKIILKNKKGEILILKLPQNSSMAGYYDLPGGRINLEELKMPYDKILNREMAEEIGKSARYRLIKKPASIAWHSYFSNKSEKEKHIFLIFFEAFYLSGKIQISKEHIDYKWVKLTKKDISKYFIKGLRKGLNNYFRV
jgi:8-oxo-dGTP pyrophosphatase MutT (NUDIX family)